MGDQRFQFGVGGLQGLRIPDVPQLLADDLADREVGRVVDGVLGEMELAALPARARQHGVARGFQSGVVVGGDELDAVQAARHKAFEEGAPVDLGLRHCDRDAEHATAAELVDADCGQNGAIVGDAVLAGLFVAGVKEQVAEVAERAVAPGFEVGVEEPGARLTCVDDRPSMPNSASTFSTSRVDTPFTYISAAASMTARHERRPRSRLWG